MLFAAGWTALNAPTQEETTEERPALSRREAQVHGLLPLYAAAHDGTGAIAVSVAVSTSLPRDLGHIAGTFVATVATVAVIWVCYRYSDRLNKAVGVAGADALARIFAFILICLASPFSGRVSPNSGWSSARRRQPPQLRSSEHSCG